MSRGFCRIEWGQQHECGTTSHLKHTKRGSISRKDYQSAAQRARCQFPEHRHQYIQRSPRGRRSGPQLYNERLISSLHSPKYRLYIRRGLLLSGSVAALVPSFHSLYHDQPRLTRSLHYSHPLITFMMLSSVVIILALQCSYPKHDILDIQSHTPGYYQNALFFYTALPRSF